MSGYHVITPEGHVAVFLSTAEINGLEQLMLGGVAALGGPEGAKAAAGKARSQWLATESAMNTLSIAATMSRQAKGKRF